MFTFSAACNVLRGSLLNINLSFEAFCILQSQTKFRQFIKRSICRNLKMSISWRKFKGSKSNHAFSIYWLFRHSLICSFGPIPSVHSMNLLISTLPIILFQRFSTPPTIFVTASHQVSKRPQDAMAVWVEELRMGNFKICLREAKIFDGPHKGITIVCKMNVVFCYLSWWLAKNCISSNLNETHNDPWLRNSILKYFVTMFQIYQRLPCHVTCLIIFNFQAVPWNESFFQPVLNSRGWLRKKNNAKKKNRCVALERWWKR